MALYVVFEERQQHLINFSRQEKQRVNDFEVSEKKIFDILFSEKLQITYTFRCNPL